jgi:hypothetical protein
MPQMKLAGNIGRWHDDSKGLLAAIKTGGEIASSQPELVPPVLYSGGFEGREHFLRHRRIIHYSMLFDEEGCSRHE